MTLGFTSHDRDLWFDGVLHSASPSELARALSSAGAASSVATFASAAEAFVHARSRAGEDDRIVAFGSFLTVADVLRALGRGAS